MTDKMLELVEIHSQLRWLHQAMMDSLVMKGAITVEYLTKAKIALDYENRRAAILCQAAGITDSLRNAERTSQTLGELLQPGEQKDGLT